MESSNKETALVPPPPGIIGSLRVGFDAIATHIAAILFPLLLDIFLWLGPHLSISQLFMTSMAGFEQLMAESGVDMSGLPTMDQMRSAVNQVNIFNALRTFPIGLPSLMTGKISTTTPFGAPLIYQIPSEAGFYGLTFLLIFVGWILGGIYFRWIASLVVKQDVKISIGRTVLRTVGFFLIWSFFFWTVGFVFLLVVGLLFLLNPLIGQGAVLVVGFLSMWLVVPIFFTSLGIFMHQENFLFSVRTSFRVSRLTMPASSLFVLTVLLVGFGLNLLWAIPASDSWLTLVGIFGHAFITTSLLAASFVYYRDMNIWVQLMMDRMRSKIPTQQA